MGSSARPQPRPRRTATSPRKKASEAARESTMEAYHARRLQRESAHLRGGRRGSRPVTKEAAEPRERRLQHRSSLESGLELSDVALGLLAGQEQPEGVAERRERLHKGGRRR